MAPDINVKQSVIAIARLAHQHVKPAVIHTVVLRDIMERAQMEHPDATNVQHGRVFIQHLPEQHWYAVPAALAPQRFLDAIFLLAHIMM